MGPRGTSEREESVTHGRQQKDRQASFPLTSRTRAIQCSWLFKPNQLSVPAVVGECTMWWAAIYSNFIFSCHSREIHHLSGSVIAVILYVLPISLNHPHWYCRSGVNSLCVLSLDHPNILTDGGWCGKLQLALTQFDSNLFFTPSLRLC